VLATAEDFKTPVADENGDTYAYNLGLSSYQMYYPFGWEMPGLKKEGDYHYGFNGMEKDDEVAGSGNSYTAEFWQYDSRLGRRWNLDPKPQISISDYAVMDDNPVVNIDPNGRYVVDANGRIIYTVQSEIKSVNENAGLDSYFREGLKNAKFGLNYDEIDMKCQIVHIYANDGTPIKVAIITSVTSKTTEEEVEKADVLKNVCYSNAGIDNFGIVGGTEFKKLLIKDRGGDDVPLEDKKNEAQNGGSEYGSDDEVLNEVLGSE